MQQEDIYYKKYMKYKQKYLLLQEQMGGGNFLILTWLLTSLDIYGKFFGLTDELKKNTIYTQIKEINTDGKYSKGDISVLVKDKLKDQLDNIQFFKDNTNDPNTQDLLRRFKTGIDNISFGFDIGASFKTFLDLIKDTIKSKIIHQINVSTLPNADKTTITDIFNDIFKDKPDYNKIIIKLKSSLKKITKDKIKEILKDTDNNDTYTIPNDILQPMRMQLLPLKASLVLLDSPFGIFTPLYPLKKALPDNIISSANELLSILISGNINKSEVNNLVETIFS
jgi:hypothetical protein